MRRLVLLSLLCLGIAAADARRPNTLSRQEKREGFHLLFNGHDLAQWTGDMRNYIPVDGAIKVTAEYGDDHNLYTRREYRDFVFRFDFCFTEAGVNNGIGIRTPMGKDAAYYGMCEVQILDHDAPVYQGLADYQVHGSAYGLVAAKRAKHRPLGQWSEEEIRVVGDSVIVVLNGEEILRADLRAACQGHNVAPEGSRSNPYTIDHQSHPGLFNEKGHIGLLGHGTGILFRNLRIKEL